MKLSPEHLAGGKGLRSEVVRLGEVSEQWGFPMILLVWKRTPQPGLKYHVERRTCHTE